MTRFHADMRIPIALLFALSACASCPEPEEPASRESAAAPAPAPASDPRPRDVDPAKLIWQGAADLDGDGDVDRITITATSPELRRAAKDLGVDGCVSQGAKDQHCRASLQVGDQSAEVIVNWQPPAKGLGTMAIRVVDIDAADDRQELIIEQYGRSTEDPWREFVVVMYDGNRLTAQPLWHSNGYNTGTLRITSGGRVLTHYESCPTETEIAYRLDSANLALEEIDRHEQQNTDPGNCAACPAVYAVIGGAERPMGEILRNLDAPAEKTAQRLRLFVTAEQRLEIVVREEKLETTYLDAVHLEVDGRRYAPSSCATDRAWCEVDGRAHVMRAGDELRLTFELDRPVSATSVARLVADGYYVPGG